MLFTKLFIAATSLLAFTVTAAPANSPLFSSDNAELAQWLQLSKDGKAVIAKDGSGWADGQGWHPGPYAEANDVPYIPSSNGSIAINVIQQRDDWSDVEARDALVAADTTAVEARDGEEKRFFLLSLLAIKVSFWHDLLWCGKTRVYRFSNCGCQAGPVLQYHWHVRWHPSRGRGICDWRGCWFRAGYQVCPYGGCGW